MGNNLILLKRYGKFFPVTEAGYKNSKPAYDRVRAVPASEQEIADHYGVTPEPAQAEAPEPEAKPAPKKKRKAKKKQEDQGAQQPESL